MKVVAFNGSPTPQGNTFQALGLVLQELEKQGFETQQVQVGNHMIRGCTACNQCLKNRDEKCVLPNDQVNEWIQLIKEADGILLGSPVHYAALGATMKAFLDRAFYVAGMNRSLFRHKVGASVVTVRRSGGLPAFQQLNSYLLYSEMLIPTSNYWNVIHGARPGEIMSDAEGVQIMQVLGQNMAWLLKLKAHGSTAVEPPALARKVMTNFVRPLE